MYVDVQTEYVMGVLVIPQSMNNRPIFNPPMNPLLKLYRERRDKFEKKPDLDLTPGFYITAEYRLGEIRGYNQAIDDFLKSDFLSVFEAIEKWAEENKQLPSLNTGVIEDKTTEENGKMRENFGNNQALSSLRSLLEEAREEIKKEIA